MTTLTRSPAFASIDELLDWSEQHGGKVPEGKQGADEHDFKDDEQREAGHDGE
jgi:hypothetical protein